MRLLATFRSPRRIASMPSFFIAPDLGWMRFRCDRTIQPIIKLLTFSITAKLPTVIQSSASLAILLRSIA
jgi:hypothetical protein